MRSIMTRPKVAFSRIFLWELCISLLIAGTTHTQVQELPVVGHYDTPGHASGVIGINRHTLATLCECL